MCDLPDILPTDNNPCASSGTTADPVIVVEDDLPDILPTGKGVKRKMGENSDNETLNSSPAKVFPLFSQKSVIYTPSPSIKRTPTKLFSPLKKVAGESSFYVSDDSSCSQDSQSQGDQLKGSKMVKKLFEAQKRASLCSGKKKSKGVYLSFHKSVFSLAL